MKHGRTVYGVLGLMGLVLGLLTLNCGSPVVVLEDAASATGGAEADPARRDTWTLAQTPWGDPDLQGIWNSKTQTPLERPDDDAGKAFLTAEEVSAYMVSITTQYHPTISVL